MQLSKKTKEDKPSIVIKPNAPIKKGAFDPVAHDLECKAKMVKKVSLRIESKNAKTPFEKDMARTLNLILDRLGIK